VERVSVWDRYQARQIWGAYRRARRSAIVLGRVAGLTLGYGLAMFLGAG